jgi:hypothetical protein
MGYEKSRNCKWANPDGTKEAHSKSFVLIFSTQMDSFRTYTLKTTWEGLRTEHVVKRRYTHFEWLREMLLREFEHSAVPVLPDKSVWEKVFYDNESQFVRERKRKLQHFLALVSSHPVLSECSYLKSFTTDKDEVRAAIIILRSSQIILKMKKNLKREIITKVMDGFLKSPALSKGQLVKLKK